METIETIVTALLPRDELFAKIHHVQRGTSGVIAKGRAAEEGVVGRWEGNCSQSINAFGVWALSS